MALTITNGDYEQFVRHEQRNSLLTFTPEGGDILISAEEGLAVQGDGYLIRNGEQVSDFNPEGRIWFAYADGADVQLHVTDRLTFGEQGGID